MEQVVIVDAIRTPMGRSKGGAFRNVRAEDLSAHLMRSLLARNPALEAAALDDIYWGCVQQKIGRASCRERGVTGAGAGTSAQEPADAAPRLGWSRCGTSVMRRLHQ